MLKKISYCLAFLTLLSTKAYCHDGQYLPLGDGHISTSAKKGYIFSCQSNFSGGKGSFRDGDWIVGDKWLPSAKPIVTGSVMWPEHYFSITSADGKLLLKSNDLPNHPTGTFPIAASDVAYYYDRNPNSIIKQNISLTIPANPKVAQEPSCLPMGMIGIALTGIAIFNGLDAQGRDAAAHEIQDSCNGHPERQGTYHYHNMSPCMQDDSGKKGKHSDLAGYALDGFGIYGEFGQDGKALKNKDLDECHGHSHLISFNGIPQNIYHYHLTREYPYTLGCFRGEVTQKNKGKMPAKEDGPWLPPQSKNGSRINPEKVLQQVASELKIDQRKLQQAIGPPPPDFSGAAKKLGIDERKLRDAFEKARQNSGN